MSCCMCDMGRQTKNSEDRIMKRATDDFSNWRLQQENMSKPFPYVFPQMPPRFRWCRRFAQALFLIEWGGFVALVLSNFPAGVVALLWGKKALLEGVGAMAFLLSMVSFVLLPLAFLARWLRHTAKLFWHCPCCGQLFPTTPRTGGMRKCGTRSAAIPSGRCGSGM